MSARIVSLPTQMEASPALLPWEVPEEFAGHRRRYLEDLRPQGAIEESLAERLVWIAWRRCRLQHAERAVHMTAFSERLESADRTKLRAGLRDRDVREFVDLAEIVLPPNDDAAERVRRSADVRATARALKILERGGDETYERALAALHPDTRTWWEDVLSGEIDSEVEWAATTEHLRQFLQEEVSPQDEVLADALDARPAVRLQAYGESYDPERMERLLAIDARLDRQFEKALSMLMQVQGMRAAKRRCGERKGDTDNEEDECLPSLLKISMR